MTQVPVVTTTLTSAEMIKYAANAFLAVKIGFANEVANICERVGAEAPEVMAGIGLDARIGARFLNPGLGWGGSCFGKDIQSLLHTAREYGYQSRLLEAAMEVNRAQRQLVIQKLQEKLFILKGRTIALLGLAFKPDTDDLRDAPSLQIAERLLQMGARVKAYDPIANDACRENHPGLRIQYCGSAQDAAQDADALVLVTEWKQFAALDLRDLAKRMARAILVDGRNLFDPEAAHQAGFDYCGIGRPQRAGRHHTVPEPSPIA
jgi:UDPglucose 6-dehydrogenase